MINVQNGLLTSRRNRPFLRNSERYTIYDLKGIVVHWTANKMKGANCWANRNYFNTTNRFASAHYLVDDETVLQCLPENEVAFHVGARNYKPIGISIGEGDKNPNYFLIGIEMCVNEDSDWDKTYQNTVELARHLLNKYNFTIFQLYRHFDITGKDCPRMMIEEKDWQKFRRDVNEGANLPVAEVVKKGIVNVDDLNIRSGNSADFSSVGKLNQGTEVSVYDRLGNWYRIGEERWVHSDYVKMRFQDKSGVVDVDGSDLNIRKGPSSSTAVVGKIKDGEKVTVSDSEGSWLEIGKDRWVHSKYIRFTEEKHGYVTSNRLVIRSGPGTNFAKVKRLTKGDIVRVFDEDGQWLKVGDSEWAHGNYIEVVA